MKLMMSRLMGMMFIQYIVQGAWVLTLGLVLSSYGMPDIIGTAYAVLGIATILSPMFVGMVADRFFSTEKLLAKLARSQFSSPLVFFATVFERLLSMLHTFILTVLHHSFHTLTMIDGMSDEKLSK